MKFKRGRRDLGEVQMKNSLETHNQSPKSTLASNWSYRRLGFANLLRMGHCAPTVMKTILDITSTEKEWLVRLSAGMPGGIGNTGFECGGITSPLVLYGHRFRSAQGRSRPAGDLRKRACIMPEFYRLPSYSSMPGDPWEGPLPTALHPSGTAVTRAFHGCK